MAHSITISGNIPLTGDMRKDAETTLQIADAVDTLNAVIELVGGNITMERGYSGPADVKKTRKPRSPKATTPTE